MKKTILILLTMAIFMAIVHFARTGRNVSSKQTVEQIDLTESVEVASSNTSTNLHFENLHVNPKLQ